MFGISFLELMVIFLLILVVMGPEKLPEVARWMGKGLREVRKASNTLRSALTMDELDVDIGSEQRLPAPPAREAEQSAIHLPADDPAPAASPAAGPPSGLDQIDDDQFDEMLERQYQIQRTEMRAVVLSAAQPSDEVFTVKIPPFDDDTTQIDAVAFSAISAAEAAS